MHVLAMGNVGKALIPMYKIRYICFYFMFLYSMAVFISWPKVGQKRNRNWWGLKTQLLKMKSGACLLHRATTPTLPLSPDGTSRTPRTPSLFLLTSGLSCSGRNPQCSEIFSLPCSGFIHPVLISSFWVNMDGLVWALNWKDATSLPSYIPDHPLPSLPIIEKHTHLFTICWYFNHQHLSMLIFTEGTFWHLASTVCEPWNSKCSNWI